MRKEVAAGGLVSRAGRVLLVRVCNLNQEKVWTFPKGHLEKGETGLDAALREVEEETGWRCRAVASLMTVGYKFKRQGRPVDKKVEWYWMEPVKKTGKPDVVEILAVKWAAAASASKLLSYPSDKKLLAAWLDRARA